MITFDRSSTTSFLVSWYGFALIFLIGCNQKKEITISGNVDYVGSAEIYFSKQPIHYKYAKKIHFPLSIDPSGNFNISIPVDSSQVIELNINDTAYPIVAKPGDALTLQIARSQFPAGVEVRGYQKPWDQLYSEYYQQDQKLLEQIKAQKSDFKEGRPAQSIALYTKRYQLASQYFRDTPLVNIYYKTIGEYLVIRLEALKYQHGKAGIHPQKIREDILREAQEFDFFTFQSLHAQRAGIRDFTNAYANTFGIADSLDQKYNQDLMQYDVKRLGYQQLDSARTFVLRHIDDRRAKAYAQMFLVAERIGEMPLRVSTPGYKEYLDRFSDFPAYTEFLQSFYEQIKKVSPGQPAVPFSIPNQSERIIHMKDFRGKYVLLDFWASWCIPCLDEFPYMKKIYATYPRNKFEILGISIEEDSLRWRQAMNQFDNPWPQLYGGNGFEQKTFKSYRGGGIPFYILVGPEGNIVRYNDIRPSFNLPQVLDSLLSEP